jgi:hypothetical protein
MMGSIGLTDECYRYICVATTGLNNDESRQREGHCYETKKKHTIDANSDGCLQL